MKIKVSSSILIALSANIQAQQRGSIVDTIIESEHAQDLDLDVSGTMERILKKDDRQASLSNRKLSNITNMLMKLTNLSSNQIHNLISNYGCFCYIGSTSDFIGNPKATPLDPLDNLCKSFHKAQNCLSIDNSLNIYKKPCYKNDTYKWYFDVKSGDSTGEIICGNKDNKNSMSPCKKTLCETEKEFALEVKKLILDRNFRPEDQYLRMNGTQFEDVCGKSSSFQHVSRYAPISLDELAANFHQYSCCGTGLNRKSFNEFLDECCYDGKVRPIGSC